MLGFAVTTRIYVNENLTKRNFAIFCKARELKLDGKISRFSTQRGRVVVKLHGSDHMHVVESLNHLSSLTQNDAAATTTTTNK